MALDVNQAAAALPDAIRKKVRLDPASNLLTPVPGKQPSGNWEIEGMACRMWNRVNGYAVDLTDEQLRAWLRAFFAFLHFMANENLSLVYCRLWIDGILAIRGACQALGWTEEMAMADEWCRALAAYLVLGGCPGKGHSLSDADNRKSGPGAFIGSGATPNHLRGARHVCWAGHRSAVQSALRPSRAGEYGWSFNAGGVVPLFLELALKDWHELEIVEALRARGVWRPILTAEEQNAGERVLAGDTGGALRAVVSWAQKYPLGRETYFERRVGGVACIVTESPGSTTADDYAATWTPNASGWLVADTGGRDTGGDDRDAEPGHATIDWSAGKVTAERDQFSLGAVTIGLPPGETIARVRSAPDGVTVQIPKAPTVETDPTVGPPPTNAPKPAEKKSVLERYWWVIVLVAIVLLVAFS